jgi:hypothetical protein
MSNLIKVEGELVVKDGTGRMIEFYEEEFILDVSDKNKARSLIRKGLITERLQKKTQGFKSVRTCQVISIEPTQEKSEVSELSQVMLKAIDMGCVPENIDSYKRQDHKLKALQRAIEVAEKRKASQKPDNVKNEGVVDD